MSGLVSIVVASYNHAEFLEQRMESLINQTYPEIEIIVIDDYSTDNSVEVLRRYERHPKVKLIVRDKNGGWVAVSNQGIGLSAGKYVIFANCDDACEPRMIEILVRALESSRNAGIAFCRSLLVNENDHVLGNDLDYQEKSFQTSCFTDTQISGSKMSRYLLHACVIPNLSAALFRKECFDRVGMLSTAYRACSDWDLFFRIASEYDFSYVAEPLNRFRQHDTTIRSVMKERATYEEYFRVLLGQIRNLDLSLLERIRFRMRVMSLWAVHLLSPTMSGISNFPFHLIQVVRLDPMALLFLIPSLLIRIVNVFCKVLTNNVIVKQLVSQKK